MRVGPEHASGHCIERDDVVGRLHCVEQAVDDQRRCIELLQRSRLTYPLKLKTLQLCSSDLRQRAESLIEKRSRVTQPVLGLAFGAEDAVERDLRLDRDGSKQHDHTRARHHWTAMRLVARISHSL